MEGGIKINMEGPGNLQQLLNMLPKSAMLDGKGGDSKHDRRPTMS